MPERPHRSRPSTEQSTLDPPTMASSDDELAYLKPGFELSSLTVPKLRSILVSHDISYPSSAKKPQLIQLVEDQVLPQARKLLNARARTKRTSRGIEDMPSSQESSVAGDEEEEMGPPPMPAKTPRGRKSKATLAAEAAAAAAEKELPPTPTTRRSRTPGGRKSTVKHPRASDTDEESNKIRPSARKTRKSVEPATETAAHVIIDEPHRSIKSENRNKGESPFSDDNPFQSGSSPAAENRRISGSTSRSRKSLGATDERRKSTSARRKTTSPNERVVEQEDGIQAPSRRKFEFQVAQLNQAQQEDIQTTEEFTPDEQLELVRDRAGRGYSGKDLVPSRSSTLTRRKKKPTSAATKSATWGVLITLIGSIAAWYRKEKVDIGYCGVGQPEWSLSNYNTNVPTWVKDNLQPVCEPCPQHAFCYPNMQVNCEHDFVLKPHPLSLGGLIPLPPTCEPDGEKVRRVKAVADKAVEELRERRAAYECGEEITKPQKGAPGGEVKTVLKPGAAKLEVAEEELKEQVGKMRRRGMSDAEFDDLWHGALGEITGREEVEVKRDG
jgi:Man1-Src1p-C-terminal domain/HeH/LEM domain